MTRLRLDLCPTPARRRGESRGKLSMRIGTAGTVDLHVTSTTGYEKRQQWEGAIAAVFDQWLNACESSRRIPDA